MTEKCAGIIIVNHNGKMLFIKRSGHGDYAGYWGLPGGHLEDGETHVEAAIRECMEEVGYKIENEKDLVEADRQISEGKDFTTFVYKIGDKFKPDLNKEHDDFVWATPEDGPSPIHPGLEITLKKLQSDELGIAKLMAEGKLPSPQRYMNLFLFDIRITGTGMSYRSGLDEFVWRDESIYLNQEFLERCNGLPVILDHPKSSVLNTKEFVDRVIGTTFIPYIKGKEVWAIVKIWDIFAAELMEDNQLSTSPCVVLYGGDEKTELSNGKSLLIEGKPKLLDHIAICQNGVWDKVGPPVGVSTINAGEMVMADEDNKAAALKAQEKVDSEKERFDEEGTMSKAFAKLDSFAKRLDAFEKEEEEREKRKSDKRAKKDAERAEAKSREDAEGMRWPKREGCQKQHNQT